MNTAFEKMLAEKADKATMPVETAMVRRTLGNENLSDGAGSDVLLKSGRFITMRVIGAECYRVDEADQQYTNKSARQWRVKATRM
jgi:hypothetical protein